MNKVYRRRQEQLGFRPSEISSWCCWVQRKLRLSRPVVSACPTLRHSQLLPRQEFRPSDCEKPPFWRPLYRQTELQRQELHPSERQRRQLQTPRFFRYSQQSMALRRRAWQNQNQNLYTIHLIIQILKKLH